LVSPPTTIGLDAPLAFAPPGEAVTVYEVIGEPPSEGAVKLTVAWPFPAVAVAPVGAPGAVAGAERVPTIAFPRSSPATQSVGTHEMENTNRLSSTFVAVHAAAPPVGLVVSTAFPAASTAAQ
jgi:hypothetical protein